MPNMKLLTFALRVGQQRQHIYIFDSEVLLNDKVRNTNAHQRSSGNSP